MNSSESSARGRAVAAELVATRGASGIASLASRADMAASAPRGRARARCREAVLAARAAGHAVLESTVLGQPAEEGQVRHTRLVSLLGKHSELGVVTVLGGLHGRLLSCLE